MRNLSLLLGAAVLSAGIAGGGYFVGDGFLSGRLADRYVTAKGLSERPVEADLAIWPIRFVVTGNDLQETRLELTADAEAVTRFLRAQGFTEAEISLDAPIVTDRQAQLYGSGRAAGQRFVVEQLIKLRSKDVHKVAEANQIASTLLQAGVVLSSDRGPSRPFYVFTGLNELKTEMVAEATQVARATAEQFAGDSGAKLGGIRRANQGVFQVLPRDRAPGIDEAGQIEKTVRVVSTLQYYLTE